MQAGRFDERAFFAAIAASDARALLIGRRALVALGLPVLTADYDYWLHTDDIERFNQAVAAFELFPSRPPPEARTARRYVLENDEHMDVLVARSMPTIDEARLSFDDVWPRRVSVPVGSGTTVWLPHLEDLIATKRFGARARDAEDIRLLSALREEKP